MAQTLIQRVVRVTPKLIKSGQRGSRAFCPLALALKAVWPSVNVCGGVFVQTAGGRHLAFGFDHTIGQWINAFDEGATVPPIDVAIDLERRWLSAC